MGLLTGYLESLKPLDVEEPIDVWVHRPFAYLLAWLLYPTPVSPNFVTCCSIALGTLGGFGSLVFGLALFIGLGVPEYYLLFRLVALNALLYGYMRPAQQAAEAVTDARNTGGSILPSRAWMLTRALR